MTRSIHGTVLVALALAAAGCGGGGHAGNDAGPPIDAFRPGVDAGGGTCSGTPDPCDTYLTAASCPTTRGCRSGGGCVGNAVACAGLSGASADCNAQLGCTFDAPSNTCSGTAMPCGNSDASACILRVGCLWEPACTGTATCTGARYVCEQVYGCSTNATGSGVCSGTPMACGLRTTAQCAGAGCELSAVCGGTAIACASLTDGASCTQQYGCHWTGTSCAGAETPCEVLDATPSPLCAHQSGCSELQQCVDTPPPCGANADQASCEADVGCSWAA